jgi:hypothetical protein
MRRRYIFLVFSILLGFGIIYIGKVVPEKSHLESIEREIEQIKVDSDSTIEYAEDVLDGVVEQKNKLSVLDKKVKDSETTIEEQVIQLEKLLKQSKNYEKMANRNADRARLMKDESIKQKQMAEVARKVTEKKLNEALNVIKQLESDYKELNNRFIEVLRKNELDTVPPIIKEGKISNKKRKEKG